MGSMLRGRMARAAGLALLVALGGCGSSGGSMGGLFGGNAQPQPVPAGVDPAKLNDPIYATAGSNPATLQGTQRTVVDFDPATECPQVQVTPGTSYYATYDGPPAPGSVRYQLSITNFARECTLLAGNQVQIKIGVEGQALLGEKGAPGSVSAPVRIAIRDRDGAVVSSKLLTASAAIAPGSAQAGFRVVDSSATVPISGERPLRSYEILVGFDEKGGVLGKPGAPAKVNTRPRRTARATG